MSMDFVLDAGCGAYTEYKGKGGEYPKPLLRKDVIHVDVDKKAIHLEVVCDIENLPFQNDVFKIVWCSNVLEHLDHPVDAIKEMKRVATHKIIIKVPNASCYKIRSSSQDHIFSWNEYTLKNLLKRFFPSIKIKKNERWQLVFDDCRKLTRRFRLLNLFETMLFGGHELTAICYCEKPPNLRC